MEKKIEKIRVTRDMIINDMGLEDVFKFFADFDTDGDPLNGVEGEVPKTLMRTDSWWIAHTPLRFTVELDGTYYIDRIYVYNLHHGKFEFKYRAGTPFAYELDRVAYPDGNRWVPYEINMETRYLNFEFLINTCPAEILIYGYKIKNAPAEPKPKKHPIPKLDRFFGTNGFVNDGDDVCRVASYIREYHNREWTTTFPACPVNGLPGSLFNPSKNKFWDFDDFYRRMHSYNIDVCPTVMLHPEVKHEENGDNGEDPATYMAYASDIYQFVARYGHNKNVDPETVRVGEGQEKKIGLGYLNWIEPANEPNGTWMGRDGYLSPFELCAMLSLCYDGHEGKYQGVGVKQADPTFKMSMSGLAGICYDYLRAMQFWATYNRKDKRLPFDAINMHHYTTKVIYRDTKEEISVDANIDERGVAEREKVYVGISPEEGKLDELLMKIADFRDRYYPEMEYWLTEFGWDTNQDYRTATAAHAYGEYNGRMVQAMWLVRGYLMLTPYLERVAMYMSRDCGPEETAVGKFGSSGLIRFPIEINAGNVIQGNKKESFYFLYTLRTLLGEGQYVKDLPSHNANVRIQQYETKDGKECYALWCTTSNCTKVPGLCLPVDPKKEYQLVELKNESYLGKRTDLVIRPDKTVAVDVSEVPVFVLEK